MGIGKIGGHTIWSKGPDSKDFAHLWVVVHRWIDCEGLLNKVRGKFGVCSHGGVGLAAGNGVGEFERVARSVFLWVERHLQRCLLFCQVNGYM